MWPQIRFFLLDALYGIVVQLERPEILTISRDYLTGVALAIVVVMNAGRGSIGWIGCARNLLENLLIIGFANHNSDYAINNNHNSTFMNTITTY